VIVPVEVSIIEMETGVPKMAMILQPEIPPFWLKVPSCKYATPRMT
jgi:hypothetical protein